MVSSYSGFLVLGLVVVGKESATCDAFQCGGMHLTRQQDCLHHHTVVRKSDWKVENKKKDGCHLFLSSSDAVNDGFLEQVRTKLIWEILEERESKPVLNLSSIREEEMGLLNDASTEKQVIHHHNEEQEEEKEWLEGTRWQRTKDELQRTNLVSIDHNDNDNDNNDVDTWLEVAPQLYRLETTMILETASIMVTDVCKDDFNMAQRLIHSEPRFLTYRPSDLSYGLQFLQIMMMFPILPPSVITPQLLLAAIDGGLQERHVSQALHTAASATSSANQRIAADTVALRKTIQSKSPSKFN